MNASTLGLSRKPSLTQEREKLERDQVYWKPYNFNNIGFMGFMGMILVWICHKAFRLSGQVKFSKFLTANFDLIVFVFS